MSSQSRRSFISRSALGLSSTWLATNWLAILEAKASTQAEAGRPPELAFLTPAQAAELDAMSSQIIPTDETAGAHEAGCVYFIDRALTTFLRESQPIYIEGLKTLAATTTELFPGAASFSALSPVQQIQLLTAIEHTQFFTTVRTHTILGMLASPVHGGNHEQAGWKLIGFDDSLKFEPPFGYYDSAGGASSR
jgi:gluconate 2-dehydrogenase gamma chain